MGWRWGWAWEIRKSGREREGVVTLQKVSHRKPDSRRKDEGGGGGVM